MEFLIHTDLTVDPMNGMDPTQTPTHFPQLQIHVKDQKLAMAMLNTYFCWISMEFSFIRLMLSYIMKKIKFCSLYLMFIVSQRGPQGEQSCHIRVLTPGAASQTTSEQPSHSLIRITVEQDQFLNVFIWSLLLSWLIWGW